MYAPTYCAQNKAQSRDTTTCQQRPSSFTLCIGYCHFGFMTAPLDNRPAAVPLPLVSHMRASDKHFCSTWCSYSQTVKRDQPANAILSPTYIVSSFLPGLCFLTPFICEHSTNGRVCRVFRNAIRGFRQSLKFSVCALHARILRGNAGTMLLTQQYGLFDTSGAREHSYCPIV